MKPFFFELCAGCLEAALVGYAGGADRVEICSELQIGGVTPTFELMRDTVAALAIPVFVLIRPRGGDFVYSEEEFLLMKQQIEAAKQAGAAGVVIGVLLQSRRVDRRRGRELLKLARPLEVTFHRAFDETPDLNEALETVIEIGADYLLTSGGEADVLTGTDTIARLEKQANGRIRIIAGGGLRLANLVEIQRRSGVAYLHGSLTTLESELTPAGEPIVCEADVREAVRLLSSAHSVF